MSGSFQFPWDTPPARVITPPDLDAAAVTSKPRGRRPATVLPPPATSTTGTSPDWLYHHLTVSGSADAVKTFAAAARGSGITPWQLDFARIEEDVFLRALAQPAHRRNLSVEGCHILARQFRERVETRQAQAAALVGHSQACPFDLHRLLPVPESILQLGPTDPAALRWLAAHWGITDRLRQVVIRAGATAGRPRARGRGRLPRTHAMISYGFFTDGETPYPAINQLADRWPAVGVRLMPRSAG